MTGHSNAGNSSGTVHSGMGVSAAEVRDAVGHFATRGGSATSAAPSLSLAPPLVIVCFDLGSVTLQAIRSHGAFVVNVLAAPQQHLSRNFARRGLAAAWDGVEHRRGPTGRPRPED